MVTLQDISIQLMKPARDLVDWKFPLSQILEEYYALLEEPCNINFGEAALVLQNSTNVYVRRIERLLGEVEVLKQTFYSYEEDEIKKSLGKEKKIYKKAYVDFENFVIIDLEKDIGKNIDKKRHCHAQKKVKLLSHRFTQLENSLTQLCIPIHVHDVLGEIIGKKYDFRCNQAVNTSGMLVDELTPYDFNQTFSSRIQKGRCSLSSYSEPKTPGTGTSGYHSITSPNGDESIINEEFEDEHISSSIENISLIDKSDDKKQESMNSNNLETSDQSVLDKSLEKYVEQNIVHNDNNQDLCTELKQLKTGDKMEHLEQVDHGNKSTENTDNNLPLLENDKQLKTCKQFEHYPKENQVVQSNDLDNVQFKEELANTWKRGNQTTKMSICSVDDLNESDWKPMPLTQGKEHIFSNNSPILKLPDNILLVQTKFCSKKRKLKPEIQKPECLTKFVSREKQLFAKKDRISCTQQRFKHLRKHELEDFMKNFDECSNGTEKCNDNIHYEAVTNAATSLLGFRVSQNQTNSMENSILDISSRNSSPASTEAESPGCNNVLHDIVESPNSNNNWCESSIPEMNLSYSLPEYQTLIEDKMKEIFEESNITTELDKTVAKWHASLQSKLSEAQIRPVFRIQDYTLRIIEALRMLEQQKISFDSIVQSQPAHEVARYFLAALQLANTYSVEIKTMDCNTGIELTLLNERKDSA